ncbi:MAG: serine/threonine protein phosphatase [Cyanobacteria bacterium CRU_2_1]|nr:serine/threonine protein phosphatase [Hydrococcus sp. RU_2_2]NJR58148.1 serine/threonine protein phosphatase [Cyanobacteria bacterium CRU_2_1]
MRRYLWAIGGNPTAAVKPGEIIADRYRCKSPGIFLDERPALPSPNSDEVPESFIPYLKLSPWQLHVPQVYDWVRDPADPNAVMLLLDQAPLYMPSALSGRGIALPKAKSGLGEVQVLPSLLEMWQMAPAIRQMNWLWQMAELWQPLVSERVVSSLLDPRLLRVEGPILRLLELHSDNMPVSLADLGKFWAQDLAPTAKPQIEAQLLHLCQQLIQGQFRNTDQLIDSLDTTIQSLGKSQTRQIQIATLSHQGPSRQRNEDACYPPSGTVASAPPAPPLVIVCDGIGGHQGGEVASNLAIKTIEQQVRVLHPDGLDPITLLEQLEDAVGTANDQISQQNDNEQRFDRQRMGTTVVMGLVRAHELYVTHVGDSRAYWITKWGCHQITLDDDVASREVRLGYSSYPQALQQPSAGSLVQALGMGNSSNLYPNALRLILDEDGVFLFCSDGLSDNDRVEENWEAVVLPLLNGNTDLKTVSQRLVDIANTQNGYDNATVGLIYCQVGASRATTIQPASTTVQAFPTQSQSTIRTPQTAIFAPTVAQPDLPPPIPQPTPVSPSIQKTQQLSPAPAQRKPPSQLPFILITLALAALMGTLAYFIVQWISGSDQAVTPPATPTTPIPNATSSPNLDVPVPISPPAPDTNSETIPPSRLFQANVDIPVLSELERRSILGVEVSILGDRVIPAGSIVYKQYEKRDDEGIRWVQLAICDSGGGTLAPSAPLETEPPEPSEPSEEFAPLQPEPPPDSLESQPADNPESQPANVLSSGSTGWVRGDRYQLLLSERILSETAPVDCANQPAETQDSPKSIP